MEKRGIIKPDYTPPEPQESDNKQADNLTQKERIIALDQDFRRRAAETVVKTKKS